RTQNALLQEQMHTLLAQLKSRDEAAVRQAAELAAMHESELAGARQRFDALFAQMEEQSARFDADHRNVIEAVNSQAGGLVERLAEIERRAETTGQQVHKASDRFVLDVQARAANAQQRLEAATSGVERQLRVSTEKFAAMRDGVLSDAEEKRRRAEGLAVQTQAVLGETRARCNAMLEDLRLRIEANKRNEQVVSACVAAGAATLGELTEKLADAREAATRSRGDLEKLIHGAAGEVIAARGALEDTMQGHRSELGRLSNDAAGLRVDFQSRFEEARASLESLIQEHRQKCSQRVEAFVGSVDHRLAHAELEASTRVTSLQGDLRVAAEAASRISAELQTTIEAAEARLRETQACFTRDAEAAQRNINRLVEKNQATLDATRTQVESLTRQAGETAASMRIEISSLKEMAHSRINRAGVEFSQFLDEASKKVDVIRQESAAVASDLAEQCAQSTDEAAGAVAESEKAAVELRRQSQLALVEVRDCLGQISGRADDLRREFCNLGDELTTSARTSAVQVQKAGDRITGQIETMREAVQRDADANFRRLSLFREQVEKSAEQMRDHAGRLLDQVNDGAAGLRKHADELLMRAQSGAERIGETAGKLLDDARLSSERFQQQAEQLLQSTESSAASLREQLHSLKAHVMGESEEIRQKIAVASHDLADARSRVEQIGEKTDAAHQRTETKTGELLREVNAVQQKSESLLAMPKELVDEARLQAEALSQMSRKISAALKQLGIAEANASQNKSALAEANEAADQKIDLMKRHTQRIGQLVGIVRQLYGTMDARIERLRGRLTQADDLVRDVPREIESLRAAFEFENNQPIEAGGSDGAISSQRGVAVVAPMRAHMNPPKRITTSPDVSPAKPSRRITGPAAAPAKELRHAAVVTSSPSLATLTAVKGSLGELVQKNQKLNQWLKDMVGEEALEARIGHQSGAAQA
ncbi:MAG TPA: hypothetical protein VNT79_16655, partial [Phycisphaerae bacterium]|nr:hypothetical protein [Phycisphaerae bacterium]